MALPDYIQEYSRTDNYTVLVTVRISQAQAQLIADLQEDWRMTARSDTMRSMLDGFAVLSKNREEREGAGEISQRTINWIKYQESKSKLEHRKRIQEDLYQSYVLAMTTDDIATRNNLLEACEYIAKDNAVEWPPADLPLAIREPEAIAFRDAALRLMRQDNVNRITVRDVMRARNVIKDKADEYIASLKQAGQIDTEIDQRSGKPTEWIIIPSINFAMEE